MTDTAPDHQATPEQDQLSDKLAAAWQANDIDDQCDVFDEILESPSADSIFARALTLIPEDERGLLMEDLYGEAGEIFTAAMSGAGVEVETRLSMLVLPLVGRISDIRAITQTPDTMARLAETLHGCGLAGPETTVGFLSVAIHPGLVAKAGPAVTRSFAEILFATLAADDPSQFDPTLTHLRETFDPAVENEDAVGIRFLLCARMAVSTDDAVEFDLIDAPPASEDADEAYASHGEALDTALIAFQEAACDILGKTDSPAVSGAPVPWTHSFLEAAVLFALLVFEMDAEQRSLDLDALPHVRALIQEDRLLIARFGDEGYVGPAHLPLDFFLFDGSGDLSPFAGPDGTIIVHDEDQSEEFFSEINPATA